MFCWIKIWGVGEKSILQYCKNDLKKEKEKISRRTKISSQDNDLTKRKRGSGWGQLTPDKWLKF